MDTKPRQGNLSTNTTSPVFTSIFPATLRCISMVFLGRFNDVDFFEYLGTYLPDPNAVDYVDATTEVGYIRDTYIEYFSTSQMAQDMRQMFFGLIPSLTAIMEGRANVSRYMASVAPTELVDTYTGILKERPLPWFYRADWYVSQKVA